MISMSAVFLERMHAGLIKANGNLMPTTNVLYICDCGMHCNIESCDTADVTEYSDDISSKNSSFIYSE